MYNPTPKERRKAVTKANSAEAVKAEECKQVMVGISQAVEFLKAEGLEPPKTMKSLRRRVVLIVRAGAGAITHRELKEQINADQGSQGTDQGTA